MYYFNFLTYYLATSVRTQLTLQPREVSGPGRHCYASCTDGMTRIRDSRREFESTEQLRNRTEKSTASSKYRNANGVEKVSSQPFTFGKEH